MYVEFDYSNDIIKVGILTLNNVLNSEYIIRNANITNLPTNFSLRSDKIYQNQYFKYLNDRGVTCTQLPL